MERYFITVPDIQFSGNYYPDIASRLRQYGRVNVPEITNEDPREPFIQAEHAFALVGHYNNVLLDMVANSLYYKTATLPESVQLLLELIGGRLLPAGPGRVDLLGKLSANYSVPIRLLEPYRKFATKRTADVPELVFENTQAIELTSRNDDESLTYAYGLQYDRDGATGEVSSTYPDTVYDSSAPFRDTDLNHYMSIEDSLYGNDEDDLRIIELLEPVPATSPVEYYKVRLSGASFISESPVTWTIRKITTNIASDWNAGIAHDPLPGGLNHNDKIYFSHPDIMWDRLDLALSASATPGYTARLEFYDPTPATLSPDSAAIVGDTLKFEITTLLGASDCRRAHIEIQYVPTGAKYKGYSDWVGGKNIFIVQGYMGQTTPSTIETDYLIRAKWKPIDPTEDTTIVGGGSIWTKSGRQAYTLPQTQQHSWTKTSLYDATDGELKDGYYLRIRFANAAGDCPIPTGLRLDQGEQYVLVYLVQGQTVEDSPLASSTGEANQEYALNRKPYVISSLRIFVDEGGGEYEWSVMTSLLRSRATDRQCQIQHNTDGSAVVKFGDGVNGRIPPIGSSNIRAMYRIGADRNGNIGANTLTINRDGVGVFKSVTNPRQGKYWIEADWSSPSALERAKVRGPATLRTMYRAVSPSDMETLSMSFMNRQGIRPVARVKAYEEAFGPKTVEIVVAGGGGAALSDDEKSELEEYFNGGTVYGYNGIVVANTRVVISNYTPRLLPIHVRIEAFPYVTETLVMQLLSSIINPSAIESDGRTFIWRFGQTVALSRIASEIFKLSPGNIFDVDVTSPSADVKLNVRELPMFDFVNSQVVIVPPSFIS